MVVGIGGDRISGTNFKDLLELVRDDERHQTGDPQRRGGRNYEEDAARYIQETKLPETGHRPDHRHRRPEHLPPRLADGPRRGHHRRRPPRHLREQGRGLRAGGRQGGQDAPRIWSTFVDAGPAPPPPGLRGPAAKDFELVSISKQKLENLKSQVRAVQIRTHLTHIIDGMPYFRGRPLPQLMRQYSVPQMIYEALTKEDDGHEQAIQLAQDLVLCATTNPTSEAAKNAAGRLPRRLADERRHRRRPVDRCRPREQIRCRRACTTATRPPRPTPWPWCPR